jgi:hypothetical protein
MTFVPSLAAHCLIVCSDTPRRVDISTVVNFHFVLKSRGDNPLSSRVSVEKI